VDRTKVFIRPPAASQTLAATLTRFSNMKYLTVLLGLFIWTDISSDVTRRTLQLSGSIAEKYQIKMTLVIQKDKVIGFYFYEKYKVKILLSGQINGNKITLRESPDIESDFKKGFIGEFKNNSFAGTWTDKMNDKEINFKATVDKDETLTIPNQILKLEGTFENVYSSEKYMSSISLQNISGDIFCFEISNGTESGCVGYLTGLVSLTNFSQGVYTQDSCEELKFSFTPNELVLDETNCDYHGVRCPFSGKYKRKN
jgi:hypothetical protein